MIIYQEFPKNYKNIEHLHSVDIKRKVSERSTSQKVLKKKNILFLQKLGLKVKKVEK